MAIEKIKVQYPATMVVIEIVEVILLAALIIGVFYLWREIMIPKTETEQ